MNILRDIFYPREFTGWHMWLVIGLFFGTIIGVNITLAVFAQRSWTGLVVRNSYVASQEFNQETARRLDQAALGWRATAGSDGETFTLNLTDGKGGDLPDLVVTADLGRTTHENDDQRLVLAHGSAGLWSAPVALGPGLWAVRITATGRGGESWSRDMRFVVRD